MSANDTPHRPDDPRYTVHKTDEQWRSQLNPTQYAVARQAATERPFTGRFWDHWDNGVYKCVGCGFCGVVSIDAQVCP